MTVMGDKLIIERAIAEKKITDALSSRIDDVWELLDIHDLDVTYPAFEASVLELITEHGARFFSLEDLFLNAYTVSEFGFKTARSRSYNSFMDAEQVAKIRASVRATTVASIKAQSGKGINPEFAAQGAKSVLKGAATRHAKKPSQNSSMERIRDDSRLGGYKRVSGGGDGDCAFCKMLISRGPVYSAESGTWLSHDHCNCGLVPARAGDGPTPTMDQKYFASPRKGKHSNADRERLQAALEEFK